MKKLLTVVLCMLMLASCSDQLTETDLRANYVPVEQNASEYQHYLEKARWGQDRKTAWNGCFGGWRAGFWKSSYIKTF